RSLKIFPVDFERLPALIHSGAQLPVVPVLPRRNAGHTPGAIRPPVVVQIQGENRIPFVEPVRADGTRVIPTMPHLALAKLPGLATEIRLFRLADLKGAIAQELGVPFGETEFPRHPGAAPLALALVPTAVHRPVPRERRAVFAGKRRLDAVGGPVLEPVVQLL